MKTIAYWKSEWLHANDLDDLIAEIQSDAFHAGELKGLADAREIVRAHGSLELNPPTVKESELPTIEQVQAIFQKDDGP